jgi:hypothetical protein
LSSVEFEDPREYLLLLLFLLAVLTPAAQISEVDPTLPFGDNEGVLAVDLLVALLLRL